MGPPGTGKGTQAQRLVQRLGMVALSSGDVLRAEMKSGTEVGKKAAQYVTGGTLVPDQVITDVMLAAIDRVPRATGFLLDGFPRTLPQAQALEHGLAQRDLRIAAVVDFQLSDDVIVRRISGRRICGECGSTYNVEFLPPKTADVCDRCHSRLIQRPDDARDVVMTRLATYRAQTAPLIKYYAERGLLRTVSAAGTAEEVQTEVLRVVKPLGCHG